MPTSPARALVATSAAALAVVLAAPSVALADNGPSHNKANEKGKGTSTSTGRHDPAGNNGTIKVDYPAPADSGHAERSHPGCSFQLRLFNFDDEQYGTITFEGQAPTRLGTLLTQNHMLLSNDPAGGGKDVDQVYSYTAAQLGLTGTAPAKQGWHIRVSVMPENTPGGGKSKVFWLSCPAPTASTTAGAEQSGGTEAGASSSRYGASGSALAGATAGQPASSSRTTGRTAASPRSLGAQSGLLAAQGTTGPVALADRGSAASQTRGSALPFTGLALGTLLAVAAAALAGGLLAVRVGRRRTQPA